MKKLLSAAILVFLFNSAIAQNEALYEVNGQLRTLFQNLAKPANHKWFLYDMAAHVSDEAFYSNHCTLQATRDDWYMVYEEMFHAAYDTVPLVGPGNIGISSNGFEGDTIPIGIMDYSYYNFTETALTTDNYFDFDTVNTILSDKYPRPTPYPYVEKGIFMAAPFATTTKWANPVFRIDPTLIFFDVFNARDMENGEYELQIDFGDGNGWVAFDPRIVSHHQVRYETTGEIKIAVALFDKKKNVPVKQSLSRLINPTTAVVVPPNEIFNLPGIKASLYKACNGRDGISGRTVIYVEGMDILDFLPSQNRTAGDIYNQMILDVDGAGNRRVNDLAQLRNMGYDFLIVDWRNSRIDMRFNALYLVNLLQFLKEHKTDNEQFVVMGESIGGVISRFALTYMETPLYERGDISPFFTEDGDFNNIEYLLTHSDIKSLSKYWNEKTATHNTRLFLSLDAPHRGVNIPISVQKSYRHAMGLFGKYVGIGLKIIAQAFNLFLDGQAAQQSLIYHIDEEHGSGFYKTYKCRNEFNTFRRDLKELGDYPKLAKVVLLSNGSITGHLQTNYYTRDFRHAGDRLLDFNAKLYARILWFIRVPIFGGSLKAYTNPDGQSKVFQANLGWYGIRIKLKWFGIRIHIGYNSLYFAEDYAETRPYCTSAGSYFGGHTALVSPVAYNDGHNMSDSWLLNLFSWHIENDGRGCILFDSHVGLNGFASINADWEMCSDGALFCFVPVASALDYGDKRREIPINTDIEHEDINVKLAAVPEQVDVIIGIPERLRNPSTTSFNYDHLNVRNDRISNLKERDNSLGDKDTYYSCVDYGETGNNIKRGYLNLEIGDEELYLENNELKWKAAYRTEYDILINKRNPHYEYPGFINPVNPLLGIYSKERDFVITPDGFADFTVDPIVTGIGLEFNNPSGAWAENQIPFENCCVNFRARLATHQPKVFLPFTTFVKAYPNPNNGQLIKLEFSFDSKGPVYADIYNVNGQKVYSTRFSIPENTGVVTGVLNTGSKQLASGVYVIRLTNGKRTTNCKLIISK